jgi:hypothetical protein
MILLPRAQRATSSKYDKNGENGRLRASAEIGLERKGINSEQKCQKFELKMLSIKLS